MLNKTNKQKDNNMYKQYKVISKAYTDYELGFGERPEPDNPLISDPIDVEFIVKASDVKQAEAEANDYMLHNYGHEAYSIDTDIREVN